MENKIESMYIETYKDGQPTDYSFLTSKGYYITDEEYDHVCYNDKYIQNSPTQRTIVVICNNFCVWKENEAWSEKYLEEL